MKVKDIPESVTESVTIGELMNLKCIRILIVELTDNPFRADIARLIDERMSELLEMKV